MAHRLRLASVAVSLTMASPVALLPVTAHAALSADDFTVRNAQDLVDLCNSPESDPLNDAADHFCHGFLSGAWQFHQALANGPEGVRLVCPPDPAPTRNQVVQGFVAWAGAHPDRMDEPAVDALFRYLVEQAPCVEGGSR
jgi:hypothetical protein